jgi:hypothetical protein
MPADPASTDHNSDAQCNHSADRRRETRAVPVPRRKHGAASSGSGRWFDEHRRPIKRWSRGSVFLLKCRLLPDTITIAKYQQVAFFSDDLNIREHAENEPAYCKTRLLRSKIENPGAAETATGAKDVVVGVSKWLQNIAVPSGLAMQLEATQ